MCRPAHGVTSKKKKNRVYDIRRAYVRTQLSFRYAPRNGRTVIIIISPPPPTRLTHTHTHQYIIIFIMHCVRLGRRRNEINRARTIIIRPGVGRGVGTCTRFCFVISSRRLFFNNRRVFGKYAVHFERVCEPDTQNKSRRAGATYRRYRVGVGRTHLYRRLSR